jgi:hypothetical protein
MVGGLAGGIMSAMTLPANLDQLSADELRELVASKQVITRNDRELNWRQVKIDKLTHEVAYYKRHYFGVKAERLPVEQGNCSKKPSQPTWRR